MSDIVIPDYNVIDDTDIDNQLSLTKNKNIKVNEKTWDNAKQFLYSSILKDGKIANNHEEMKAKFNKQLMEKSAEYFKEGYVNRFMDPRIQEIGSKLYLKQFVPYDRDIELEDSLSDITTEKYIPHREFRPKSYKGFRIGMKVRVDEFIRPEYYRLVEMVNSFGEVIDFFPKYEEDRLDKITREFEEDYYVVVKFEKRIPNTNRDFSFFRSSMLIPMESAPQEKFNRNQMVRVLTMDNRPARVIKDILSTDPYARRYVSNVLLQIIDKGEVKSLKVKPYEIESIEEDAQLDDNIAVFPYKMNKELQTRILSHQPRNFEKDKFDFLGDKHIHNRELVSNWNYTLKVDGVRMLFTIYIDENNALFTYFTNRKGENIAMNNGDILTSEEGEIFRKLSPIVVDGELATVNDENFYFIYDLITFADEDVISLTFKQREQLILDKILNENNRDKLSIIKILRTFGLNFNYKYTFNLKELRKLNYEDIVTMYNKMYERILGRLGDGLSIPHDGLIFIDNTKGYFKALYKWKPLREITVDFRIMEGEEKDRYYLCMGANEKHKKSDSDKICPTTEQLYSIGQKSQTPYFVLKKYFNNFEHSSGDIFEFKFTKSTQGREIIVPVRKRNDKDKPNYQKVVVSTRRSFRNPVTLENIQEIVSVNEIEIRFGRNKEEIYKPSIIKNDFDHYKQLVKDDRVGDRINRRNIINFESEGVQYEAEITDDDVLSKVREKNKDQLGLEFHRNDSVKIAYSNESYYLPIKKIDINTEINFLRYKYRETYTNLNFPNWVFDFSETKQLKLDKPTSLLDVLHEIREKNNKYEFEVEWNNTETFPRRKDIDEILSRFQVDEKEGYFKDVEKGSLAKIKAFHNDVKWNNIYKPYIQKGSNLLELGGGRYNDLHKWFDLKLDNVLVIDSDKEALEWGARRYKKKLSENGNKGPKVYGLHIDFTADNLANVVDELFDEGEIEVTYFDNIVCNFAIHYACKSEEKYKSFINNVNDLLDMGGKFMYTTMDGVKLFDKLKDKSNNQFVEISDKHGLIAKFTKRYGSELNKKLTPFSQEIDVYVSSIGSENKETLVDIKYIDDDLNEHYYHHIETSNFETFYNDTYDLDKEEKEFSFLNVLAVYEKYVQDDVSEEVSSEDADFGYDSDGYAIPPPPPLPEGGLSDAEKEPVEDKDEDINLEEIFSDVEDADDDFEPLEEKIVIPVKQELPVFGADVMGIPQEMPVFGAEVMDIKKPEEDYDPITEILPTLVEDYEFGYSMNKGSLKLPKDYEVNVERNPEKAFGKSKTKLMSKYYNVYINIARRFNMLKLKILNYGKDQETIEERIEKVHKQMKDVSEDHEFYDMIMEKYRETITRIKSEKIKSKSELIEEYFKMENKFISHVEKIKILKKKQDDLPEPSKKKEVPKRLDEKSRLGLKKLIPVLFGDFEIDPLEEARDIDPLAVRDITRKIIPVVPSENVNEIVNVNTTPKSLTDNIKLTIDSGVVEISTIERENLIVDITGAYRCLVNMMYNLKDIIHLDGVSYKDIMENCDIVILERDVILKQYALEVLPGFKIIEKELRYPGSLVKNVRGIYLKSLRKNIKKKKRSILMRCFVESVYENEYSKKLNEEMKDKLDNMSIEERYIVLMNKIINDLRLKSRSPDVLNGKISKLNDELKSKKDDLHQKIYQRSIISIEYSNWYKNKEKKDKLYEDLKNSVKKKYDEIDNKIEMIKDGRPEKYLNHNEVKKIKMLKKQRKTYDYDEMTDSEKQSMVNMTLLGSVDAPINFDIAKLQREMKILKENITNIKEKRKKRNIDGKEFREAYKHIAKQVKEFYKLNIMRDIDLVVSQQEKEFLLKPVPSKLDILQAENYLASGTPVNDSIIGFKNTAGQNIFEIFKCLFSGYRLNLKVEGVDYISVDNYVYSKIIADMFENPDLADLARTSKNPRKNYNDAKMSYILSRTYESLKNVGSVLKLEDKVSSLGGQPILYNGDPLLGIDVYGSKKYGKNLYGSYLSELRDKERESLILSSFISFPNGNLNKFVVNRGKFLIDMLKDINNLFTKKDDKNIVDVINGLSNNCVKYSGNIRFPMPRAFYVEMSRFYKCDGSDDKCLGNESVVIVNVWNYLIELVLTGIPVDYTSIPTITDSYNNFFEDKFVATDTTIDNKDIELALNNIRYFFNKNFKPSGDFNDNFEQFIKNLFEVEELSVDVILSKMVNESMKNRIRFFL